MSDRQLTVVLVVGALLLALWLAPSGREAGEAGPARGNGEAVDAVAERGGGEPAPVGPRRPDRPSEEAEPPTPIDLLPRDCQLRLRLRSEHEIPSGIFAEVYGGGRPIAFEPIFTDEVVIDGLPCVEVELVLGGARGVVQTQRERLRPEPEPAPWTELQLAPPCVRRVRAVDTDGVPIEGAWWGAHPLHDGEPAGPGGIVEVEACGNSWGAGYLLAHGHDVVLLGVLPEDGVPDVMLPRAELIEVVADCPGTTYLLVATVRGLGGERRCEAVGDGWRCPAPAYGEASIKVSEDGGDASGSVRVGRSGGSVTVRCGEHPPVVEVAPVTALEDGVASASLRVRVRDIDGAPVEGARVHLGAAGGGLLQRLIDERYVTGPDGWAPTIEGLAPGPWKVFAGGPGGEAVGDVVLGEGETAHELRLRRHACLGVLAQRVREGWQLCMVSAGSVHWAAGLRPGDRVVAIDDEPVTDDPRERWAIEAGEALEVEVDRPGVGRLEFEVVCP